MAKKITRKLNNETSVRMLADYLTKHFKENTFPVRVTIEKWTPRRTHSQNALIHAYFDSIAEIIGDDPKSVKADIKAMFLPEVEGLHGVLRTKDTHELSTPEMSDFVENIHALASEMGWEI